MTDTDIIKALECCSTYGVSCTNCPAYVSSEKSTCREVLKGAVEIINRQKAEIERLTTASPKTIASIKKMYATAKAEAVKEFAERLKERFESGSTYSGELLFANIDNLVKEMVGDDNG